MLSAATGVSVGTTNCFICPPMLTTEGRRNADGSALALRSYPSMQGATAVTFV
jgi:hypothetical protein